MHGIRNGVRLDPLDRKSLKILADSTRENQGESELTRDLLAAADSGERSCYERARDNFDALPPEQRRTIGAGAVIQAETVKNTLETPKIVDARASAKAPEKSAPGIEWGLGKAEEAARAQEQKNRSRAGKQAEATRQAPLAEQKNGDDWNWRELPDDPSMNRNRKSRNPLQALREDLLGPGAGQTWRRSLPSGE